jgi:hypothetical protein
MLSNQQNLEPRQPKPLRVYPPSKLKVKREKLIAARRVDLVATPGLSHCRHRKPSLLQGQYVDAFRRRQVFVERARRSGQGRLNSNHRKTQERAD